METSATNRRIRELLTALKENKLKPQPDFQRKLIWSNKDKQQFIETILMEYPFPEIYVASDNVNPDTGEAIELLVDGQQRITTINQYFTGSADFKLGSLTPYAQLTPQEKSNFLEYKVVVRDLGLKPLGEIKEVFTRINSTKYGLTAMEIHNARYDGAFKKFAEELSQNSFFDHNSVFKAKEIRRMGDIVFTLSISITALTTYFNRDDELESFLEKYNDEFPQDKKLLYEFSEVFNFIDSLGFDSKSRIWKKSELFTSIIEIHRLLFKEQLKLNNKTVGKNLNIFFNIVSNQEIESNFPDIASMYHKATLQASNDRSNRIRRGEIIQTLLKKGILGLEKMQNELEPNCI